MRFLLRHLFEERGSNGLKRHETASCISWGFFRVRKSGEKTTERMYTALPNKGMNMDLVKSERPHYDLTPNGGEKKWKSPYFRDTYIGW